MRRLMLGTMVAAFILAPSFGAGPDDTGPRWEQLGGRPLSLVAGTAVGESAYAASTESAHVTIDSGGAWAPLLATLDPDGIVHVASVPGAEGGLVAGSKGELFTRRPQGEWMKQDRNVRLFAVGGPTGTTIVAHADGWQGRSDDFGRSWQKLTDPGIRTDWTRMTYGHGALYMASMQGTVVRSEDLGATWETLDDRMLVGYVSEGLSLDPLVADRIYRPLRPTGFFNLLRRGPPTAAGAREEVPLKLARSEDGARRGLTCRVSTRRRASVAAMLQWWPGRPRLGRSSMPPRSWASELGGRRSSEAWTAARPGRPSATSPDMGRVLCLATEPTDTHTAYCGRLGPRSVRPRAFSSRETAAGPGSSSGRALDAGRRQRPPGPPGRRGGHLCRHGRGRAAPGAARTAGCGRACRRVANPVAAPLSA